MVAQIETLHLLQNIRAIAQTDGIDMLMLGPDDFRINLGLAINSPLLETPVLLEAQKTVVKTAREAGKLAACITPTPEMAQLALELGCSLFIGGADLLFLRDGSEHLAKMLRQTLGLDNSNS